MPESRLARSFPASLNHRDERIDEKDFEQELAGQIASRAA
jgi:hypothetical protein